MFSTKNAAETTTDKPRRSSAGYRVALGLGGVGAVAALVAGSAFAANADSSPDTTDGHVAVTSAISLTGLTPNFTLTGLPGATVTGVGAVVFNVETNNSAGYIVTVQSATTTLVPGTAGNTDSIPVGALSVSEAGTTFTPISSTTPFAVHTQSVRSVSGGDSLSNDYRVTIPFVNADTYTVTLDYIASTL